MKFLVDENLAPKLVSDLADLFPDSIHVRPAELGSTPDAVIWEYAKEHGFTFLTKDKDFASLSITWGRSTEGDPAANRQLFDCDDRAHCPRQRHSIL